MDVRAGIITGYGINADFELAEAFRQAGAEAGRIHINDLIADPDILLQIHILGFPGGFSFGDHINSGLVFANLCKKHLREPLERFRDDGKLIIGICNGFQILVKMGILPNIQGNWEQEVSLVHNDTGLFMDRWVPARVEKGVNSAWCAGIDRLDLPIRHGEGKFIVSDEGMMAELEERKIVALRYDGENPNGSAGNIAGITDTTGRIFGLMPHPEAFLIPQNHPEWVRTEEIPQTGCKFFRNAVQYVKNNLKI